MRLSMALAHSGPSTSARRVPPTWSRPQYRSTALGFTLVAVALILGTAGLLFGPAKPAAASTVFASGQVFASVGSAIGQRLRPSDGQQLNTLTDSSADTYTAGSAFDAKGDLYVADDITGQVSEYGPGWHLHGGLRLGTLEPAALPRLRPGGQPLRRPAGHALHHRVQLDWPERGEHRPRHHPRDRRRLDRSRSDQCTFLYTSETDEIYSYNKCTNTPGRCSTRHPFQAPTRIRSRSSPTATSWWPTPIRSCCSTLGQRLTATRARR